MVKNSNFILSQSSSQIQMTSSSLSSDVITLNMPAQSSEIRALNLSQFSIPATVDVTQEISADADNQLSVGSDGKLFTSPPQLSTAKW